MKKDEAKKLSFERSKLVIEYLMQILSDSEKVSGKMNFSDAKIEGKHVCVLDIFVPTKKFERHLNLGITIDHCDVFYEQLFNDIFETFVDHESICLSNYYSIKYVFGENFSGIDISNLLGSIVKLNFISRGNKFSQIINDYSSKISNAQKEQKVNHKNRM